MRYRLSTGVAEWWVPLVPVAARGDSIGLARGSVLAADEDESRNGVVGRLLEPWRVFAVAGAGVVRDGAVNVDEARRSAERLPLFA